MVLGLSEVTKPDALRASGGVWFALEHAQIHIGVDPTFRPATKAHPALAVASADELSVLAVRLRAAGYPVENDDRLERTVRFFTTDPFGNRLELSAPRPTATARRSIIGAGRTATARNRQRKAPRRRV